MKEIKLSPDVKTKIPREFGLKWIDALRGKGETKYEQVDGTLYDNTDSSTLGMCCLGVALHVCGVTPSNLEYGDMPFDLPSSSFKDKEVPDFLFVEDAKSQYTDLYLGIPAFLAAMNDNDYTFEQIADYIEQNLLEFEDLEIIKMF